MRNPRTVEAAAWFGLVLAFIGGPAFPGGCAAPGPLSSWGPHQPRKPRPPFVSRETRELQRELDALSPKGE